MPSCRFPDFYILGAPRAGTSSLVRYFDEHSQIFVPKFKEPRYFAEDSDDRPIKEEEAYLDLFKDAPSDAILGEAMTDHLLSEIAVDNKATLRDYFEPNIRLLESVTGRDLSSWLRAA